MKMLSNGTWYSTLRHKFIQFELEKAMRNLFYYYYLLLLLELAEAEGIKIKFVLFQFQEMHLSRKLRHFYLELNDCL